MTVRFLRERSDEDARPATGSAATGEPRHGTISQDVGVRRPHRLDILRGGSQRRASKRGAGSALSQELREPRDIVLRDEDLRALGSGRGCVIRDGVAVYYD